MLQNRLTLRVACVAVVIAVSGVAGQQNIPDGFEDEHVAAVPFPTALAATPDGRILIASQFGQLHILQNGALVEGTALDLGAQVCAYRERGLAGIAVDPDFAANGFIYLSYTFNKFGDCAAEGAAAPVGRVSRFVLDDGNWVARDSEQVLIDNIPSPIGVHNLDDVEFGKDGYLYVSVGDGGCDYAGDSGCFDSNDAARDRNTLVGKVLRITRDGGIPADNPFTGSGTVRCNEEGGAQPGQVCQEIFATGLRNPWRLAFDPNAPGTRFFINDVGQDTWEEINEAVAGAEYGWNTREGFCANGSTTDCSPTPLPGLTNPIFAYDRAEGCASITGGAFVPNGAWPAEFDGAYIFSDYVCGSIFTLHRTGDGSYERETFVTGLGESSATDLMFGPGTAGTALYYTTYAGDGEVRRIEHVGSGNRKPTAVIGAVPTSGEPPLLVQFDGTASSDPDGGGLTYAWDFGDGSQAAGSTVQHTYDAPGAFTATLTVTDPEGSSATAAIRIDAGNTPPEAAILSPAADHTFAVGDTVTLAGRARDQEDGELPASSLGWRVILHHNTHTHGFIPPTAGNNVVFQAPGPENLEAATTSYLEVQLTATDSAGRATTISQNLMPRTAEVTFTSVPAGAMLRIDNAQVTTPVSFRSWVNFGIAVEAPSQTGLGGSSLAFASWSDGGTAAHTVITPAVPATYTATFSTDATPQPGVYAASASSIENDEYAAARAIDGDTGTRWSSAFVDPQWLKIDFGSTRDIERVLLHWETAHARAYLLQVSDDGMGWTTVFETASGDGGIDDVRTPGARGRFLRMYGTARGTEWGYSLFEVQVFGESGGAEDTSPFHGVPAPAPGTIQAEDFDSGDAGAAYLDLSPGNDGGQYRATDVDIEASSDIDGGFNVGWMAPGEWLQYAVDVATAGTYTLHFRVASEGNGGTFHLDVNGVDRSGPLTIPDTGGWQAWTTLTVANVSLAAGLQTWRLMIDGGGPAGVVGNINHIRIAPDGSDGGSASTPFRGTPAVLPGVLQAEDFDNGGAGIAYQDHSSGNEGGEYRSTDVDIAVAADVGGGYTIGWAAAAEWLAYTVVVEEAGQYDIDVRVACDGPGGTFHIEVDGVDKTGPVSVPDTGGWQTWTTLRKAGVSLGVGQQTWRLVMDAAGPANAVGNVNSVSVAPASGGGSPATLIRAPYLQQVTDTGATVVWTTREPGAASVRYSSGGGTSITAPAVSRLFSADTTGLAVDFYQHEARLSNLAASTSYTYDVLLGGQDATAGQDSFTTTPVHGTGSVRFIAFGNSGRGSAEQVQLATLMAADSFDLAIHGGDVAYGTASGVGGGSYPQYDDWVFGILRSLDAFASLLSLDRESRRRGRVGEGVSRCVRASGEWSQCELPGSRRALLQLR